MMTKLQHITQNGESFFAITRGAEILKALKTCKNNREALIEFKKFNGGATRRPYRIVEVDTSQPEYPRNIVVSTFATESAARKRLTEIQTPGLYVLRRRGCRAALANFYRPG